MQKTKVDISEYDKGDSHTKFSDLFDFVSIIGQGSFGKVVAARFKETKQECAVKIIKKEKLKKHEYEALLKESEILAQLKHPNIVRLLNVFETATRILLMLEWAKEGNLMTFINERKAQNKPITDDEASTIMKSILAGIEYFHSRAIVHRDIKPENIILASKTDLSKVKICDFGLAAQYDMNGNMHRTMSFDDHCGTRAFMAPEVWYSHRHGKPVDIWGAGLIMYMLLAGKHPLYKDGESITRYTNRLKHIQWEFPDTFSELARNIFLKMTREDQLARYTADACKDHPWITRQFKAPIPLAAAESMIALSKSRMLFRMIKLLYVLQKEYVDDEIDENYVKKIEVSNKKYKFKNNADALKSVLLALNAKRKSPSKKGVDSPLKKPNRILLNVNYVQDRKSTEGLTTDRSERGSYSSQNEQKKNNLTTTVRKSAFNRNKENNEIMKIPLINNTNHLEENYFLSSSFKGSGKKSIDQTPKNVITEPFESKSNSRTSSVIGDINKIELLKTDPIIENMTTEGSNFPPELQITSVRSAKNSLSYNALQFSAMNSMLSPKFQPINNTQVKYGSPIPKNNIFSDLSKSTGKQLKRQSSFETIKIAQMLRANRKVDIKPLSIEKEIFQSKINFSRRALDAINYQNLVSPKDHEVNLSSFKSPQNRNFGKQLDYSEGNENNSSFKINQDSLEKKPQNSIFHKKNHSNFRSFADLIIKPQKIY